jgi:hypothetical protein
MGSKTVTDNEVLYEQDFYAWTVQTAEKIRQGRFEDLAREALAEEIEDMGKRDYRQVESLLTQLILHLLKWKYQSGRRSRSWQSSFIKQRLKLARILADSGSLKAKAERGLEQIYQSAVKLAEVETGIDRNKFPDQCPFDFERLLTEDYWTD